MPSAEPHFRWPVRVYIEDTDAGGVVFYINYLKYMERARTELMRTLGYQKRDILDQQRMFVVHSLQASYKAPARLDDELAVSADILKVGRTYIVFEQNVWRDEEQLCHSQVKVAYVGKETFKPQAFPDEVRDSLSAMIVKRKK
jgi:tol-pal system-associated acyl-CoA thioesterase